MTNHFTACRAAAARVSFAHCAAPAAPPQGREPTEAELQPLILSLSAINCCSKIGRALLGSYSPDVCELLGNSATYRLAAACNWAFGEEALRTLRVGLRAAQAANVTPAIANVIWEALLAAVGDVVLAACSILESGRRLSTSSQAPPYAKTVLATQRERERILDLLNAAAKVVVAADRAAGAF